MITRNDSILNRAPSGLAGGGSHQQLERPVGGFEVITGVLEVLEGVEDAAERRRVELQAELGGLQLQRRSPGELADDHAGPVADEIGRNVLVGVGAADERARVQAGLVGERRRPDVGPLGIEVQVDELCDVMGNRGRGVRAGRPGSSSPPS